jgi:hypothetical protein
VRRYTGVNVRPHPKRVVLGTGGIVVHNSLYFGATPASSRPAAFQRQILLLELDAPNVYLYNSNVCLCSLPNGLRSTAILASKTPRKC